MLKLIVIWLIFMVIFTLGDNLKSDTVRKQQQEQQQLFSGGGTLLSSEYQEKLNSFYGNPKQKWKLIYKATRDGFNAEDFHRLCDDKGPTISIAESKDGGYLFGGFTTQSWTSVTGYKKDEKAFLFTLTNPFKIAPTKFLIASGAAVESAVFHSEYTGPSFGDAELVIGDRSNLSITTHWNFPEVYVDTTGKDDKLFTGSGNSFIVKEIEVYKCLNCNDDDNDSTTDPNHCDVNADGQQELFKGTTVLSPEYQKKLNEFYDNPKQKWDLCYKATIDGFGVKTFHQKCDNKGPTMTIIQSSDGDGYLFGGFTNVPWTSSSGYKTDPKAFLFTLHNPHHIPAAKLLVSENGVNSAVYHSSFYGPSFGRGDIRTGENSNLTVIPSTNFPQIYLDTTKIGDILFTGISDDIKIKDIEVYKFLNLNDAEVSKERSSFTPRVNCSDTENINYTLVYYMSNPTYVQKTWATKTFTYRTKCFNTTLRFEMQNKPGHTFIDNISVKNARNNEELLINGDFENTNNHKLGWNYGSAVQYIKNTNGCEPTYCYNLNADSVYWFSQTFHTEPNRLINIKFDIKWSTVGPDILTAVTIYP